MADKARNKAQDKAGGDSERRDATQRRRVADRILHKNLRLNEILLDSLPHPAMLIHKDRTILAANHIAKQLGAKVGECCSRSFGQSEFIGEQDKKYINDHKEVPPGGTHCTFCKADKALEKQTHTNNPEVKAWDKIWDTHWTALDEETFLHYAVDVTHISREDERLRMSEIKYRTLAQNIPGLVYRILVKQDNRMLFFNTMLEAMTGFKESELEKGKVCSIEPHILAEDRDKVVAAVKHGCDEKEPFEVEYRFKHKNGDIKWFNEIGRPLFGPGDELLFIDGIITDITDHKRAEEALAESEGKFRALFEQAAVGVSQVETKTGRFLKVNQKYCDIVGYSPEEMMSRTFQEITHPEDLPKDLDNMKKLVKGDVRKFSMEKRYLHKSGAIVWVSLSVSAMWGVGERPNCHIAVVEDITERKQAEEARRDGEEKWRSLAETAPVVIMNVSRDGTISFINHPIDRYTLEEVIGTRIYDYLPQDQHDIMRKSLERVFETGKPDSFEILGEGAEGPETAWYENHIGPILNQDGKVANVTMVAIDITERKRAEESLRENEERWRSLTSNTNDIILILDIEGNILYTNRVYPPHEMKDVAGHSIFEFMSEESNEVTRESIKKLLRGEGPQTLESAVRLSESDTAQFEVKYVSMLANGEVDKLIAVAKDITERKQAEEALKESEERYKALFKSAPDGIIVADVETGQYIHVNPSICKRLGYSEEEIKGLSQFRGIHPKGETDKIKRLFYMQASGEIDIAEDIPFVKKDGTICYFDVNSVCVEIDGIQRVIGLLRDITERKRVEAKVRESEERYRAIFEQAADSIVLVDGKSSALVEFNDKACENLGYTREEFGKLKIPDFEVIESAEQVSGHIEKIIREGSDTFETKHRTKDGRIRDILVSSKAISVHGGDFVQSIWRDVTERKRAEAERERLMAELEATNKELQSIVYTTSHDLQTPLVNIKGFGGELGKYCGQLNALLENKTAGKDTERQIETLLNKDIPEAIKVINAGTDKMRSLLDGLMYLSRVGEDRLNITSLDMNELVKNVRRTLKYQIKEKGASVTIEKLPECMGDARQIDQVFSNLLDNAVKYLEAGRKGEIRISGVVEKDTSIYCVEDNGIGIAPEHREKIFEIFYRLDPAVSSTGEGLGLTIVERILDRNNGLIRVESEVGKGSKFFVSLPHAKLSSRGK